LLCLIPRREHADQQPGYLLALVAPLHPPVAFAACLVASSSVCDSKQHRRGYCRGKMKVDQGLTAVVLPRAVRT
jgi:hypothetical protein